MIFLAPGGSSHCTKQKSPEPCSAVTYGGDGMTTFALPDLRSRVPLHAGPGFTLGQTGGAETVTLTSSQIPAHIHVPQAQSGAADKPTPVAERPSRGSKIASEHSYLAYKRLRPYLAYKRLRHIPSFVTAVNNCPRYCTVRVTGVWACDVPVVAVTVIVYVPGGVAPTF